MTGLSLLAPIIAGGLLAFVGIGLLAYGYFNRPQLITSRPEEPARHVMFAWGPDLLDGRQDVQAQRDTETGQSVEINPSNVSFVHPKEAAPSSS